MTAVAKLGDKRKDILLCKRFAAGHLDKWAAKLIELCKDIVESDPLATIKCVLAVTPDTPHRAAGEPHERAWPPGMRRLALDREENFCNAKLAFRCRHRESF